MFSTVLTGGATTKARRVARLIQIVRRAKDHEAIARFNDGRAGRSNDVASPFDGGDQDAARHGPRAQRHGHER